jgi:hypothetical protein
MASSMIVYEDINKRQKRLVEKLPLAMKKIEMYNLTKVHDANSPKSFAQAA